MLESTLAYIGTILVGIEFLRKFTTFQAFFILVAVYPLEVLWRAYKRVTQKSKVSSTLFAILLLLLAILFVLAMIPITVGFYAIWFVILVLGTVHNLVNLVYRNLIKQKRMFTKPLLTIMLSKYGKDDEESVSKVLEMVEKAELPILPIVGIILLTISFGLSLS